MLGVEARRIFAGEAVPSPLRFSFGASSSDGAPTAHVIEYERLARYGSDEGERLYATRQSSVRTATSPWHTPPTTFSTHTMADPKKQEKDFTKEVDALLPEVQSLAQVCSRHPWTVRCGTD